MPNVLQLMLSDDEIKKLISQVSTIDPTQVCKGWAEAEFVRV